MQPLPEITCPIGGHWDNVAKVSALYRGGISEAQKSGLSLGGGIGLSLGSERSQTMLSKKLAPPKKSTLFRVLSVGVYAYSLVGLNLVLSFSGAFIYHSNSPYAPQPWPASQTLPAVLGIALVFFITLSLDIWDSVRSKWGAQRRIWNQLYYCARHDVVFLPGERPVSAEEMGRFLHERVHK